MNDYRVIDRKEIEGIVSELEEQRNKMSEKIIQAQRENIPELISLYRGEYFATGLAISKLKKRLQIPFEDIVQGVREGIFDARVVMEQLGLEERITGFVKDKVQPVAEMLVAAWKNVSIDNDTYTTFEALRQKILSGEDDEWGLYLEYGIQPDMGRQIIGTWKN